MEKVCKDKTFNASGCRCFLFARNPEIFSDILVGKRMEWRIIPKGNLLEVAATEDGMYRTAWKHLTENHLTKGDMITGMK